MAEKQLQDFKDWFEQNKQKLEGKGVIDVYTDIAWQNCQECGCSCKYTMTVLFYIDKKLTNETVSFWRNIFSEIRLLGLNCTICDEPNQLGHWTKLIL